MWIPKETTPKGMCFCWCTNSPNKEWDKEYTPAENEKTSPTDFGKVRKIIYSKSAGWDGDMGQLPAGVYQPWTTIGPSIKPISTAPPRLTYTCCWPTSTSMEQSASVVGNLLVVRIITPLPCWWHSDFERPNSCFDSLIWYRNYAPRE